MTLRKSVRAVVVTVVRPSREVEGVHLEVGGGAKLVHKGSHVSP